MSKEDCAKHVENEVFLLLQEELEVMGSCLQRFGLPTPDAQNRIHRMPKVIAEEMFMLRIKGKLVTSNVKG